MRAPSLARMPAVAAPRPDAEPVTITHNPSFDIASSCCYEPAQAFARALPYHAAKCETPLGGIGLLMPPRQARIPASPLVRRVDFPQHRAQESAAVRPSDAPIKYGERCVGE